MITASDSLCYSESCLPDFNVRCAIVKLAGENGTILKGMHLAVCVILAPADWKAYCWGSNRFGQTEATHHSELLVHTGSRSVTHVCGRLLPQLIACLRCPRTAMELTWLLP